MPAMMPLPSMFIGPIKALGPYSIDGSHMRGSIIMRIGMLPCMPPVATTEAYLDLACQRYQLMRTHRWDDEVVARLRAARDGDH